MSGSIVLRITYDENATPPRTIVADAARTAIHRGYQVEVYGMPAADLPDVHELAREALQAWIENNRDALRAEVERQIAANRKELAVQMVESFAAAAGDRYALKITVADRRDES